MFVMNLICDKHPLRKKGRATEYSVWGFYNIREMPKNSKKYAPKPFESDGNASDTSANIYMSMLMSYAWQQLSKNAQVLYVYCKAQYYAEKRKPKPEHRQLSEQEQRQCFTMNKSKWQKLYKIYKSDNGQFNKDMKQLIEYGFVELLESGKNVREKNTYILSSEWKQIRKP